MAEPDDKERQLLVEFRRKIPDLPLTTLEQHDMYLLTWIRAREHDLKRAEEMIRKSFEWRRTTGINTLLSTWKPPQGYSSRYGYEITGHDDEDCPVVICNFGAWNVRKAVEDGERDLWLRYLQLLSLKVKSRVEQKMEEKDKYISNFVMIFDMAGFSFRQLASIATVEAFMESVRQFEANYPETLKAAYLINANRFVTIIFNIVKPLLSARTLSKVQIYDSNPGKWGPVLQNNIPPAALPVYFGGKKADSKLFRGDRAGSFAKDSGLDLSVANVEAGGQFKVEYDVQNLNTLISWKFTPRKHDIGFSVRYNDKADVVPYARFESRKGLQQSSVLCEKIGTYVLIFDNTYSRLRSKILDYNISLEILEDHGE